MPNLVKPLMCFTLARSAMKRESTKDQSLTFVRLVLNLRLDLFPEKQVSLPLNGLVRSLIIGTGKALTGANAIKLTSAMTRYQAGSEASATEGKTKLSSNENPLGPTSKSIQVLRRSHISLERYPGGTLEEVEKVIANLFKVNPNNLTLGNGSDELLSALCALLLKEGDEAIVCEHGFLMYRTQILASKALPVIVKGDNFRTWIRNVVRAINGRTKAIFLTSPANPTGLCLSMRALAALQALIPAGVTLVLDLAYAEFAIDERYVMSEGKFAENVITLRTFSKLYGLAGLRAGWMHTTKALIPVAKTVLSPFNVNKVAKAILAEVLNGVQHRELSASFNLFWTTKLIAKARAKRLNVLNASANFVTMRLSKRLPAWLVRKGLSHFGLAIRSTAEYKVFNGIRASLGSSEANEVLLKSLTAAKVVGASVRSECDGPFRPAQPVWTELTNVPRGHLRGPSACTASARLRRKLLDALQARFTLTKGNGSKESLSSKLK
ncbi:MAG: pyridoxal phosphate-dependent aminotransferase [Candidatus Hodgkinia cicadicola]